MVVSVKTGTVAIYDAQTRALLSSLQTGRGADIYMDAEHNRALISCTPDNFVAVIDLVTLSETMRIPVDGPTVLPLRDSRLRRMPSDSGDPCELDRIQNGGAADERSCYGSHDFR